MSHQRRRAEVLEGAPKRKEHLGLSWSIWSPKARELGDGVAQGREDYTGVCLLR